MVVGWNNVPSLCFCAAQRDVLRRRLMGVSMIRVPFVGFGEWTVGFGGW